MYGYEKSSRLYKRKLQNSMYVINWLDGIYACLEYRVKTHKNLVILVASEGKMYSLVIT